MNEFKYQITQIFFLLILGIGTYWAFTHLDNGIYYERDDIVVIDQNEQEIPDETIAIINNETLLDNQTTGEESESIDQQDSNTDNTLSPNDELISELEAILETGVILRSGQSGERIGVVQEFLSRYFDNRDISIDNDYGPTTNRLVTEFQNSELNGGDGRVGPNTLGAMINWLQNN